MLVFLGGRGGDRISCAYWNRVRALGGAGDHGDGVGDGGPAPRGCHHHPGRRLAARQVNRPSFLPLAICLTVDFVLWNPGADRSVKKRMPRNTWNSAISLFPNRTSSRLW